MFAWLKLILGFNAHEYVSKYHLDEETEAAIDEVYKTSLEDAYVSSFVRFINSTGVTDAQTARGLGVHPAQIKRWRDGQRPDLRDPNYRKKIRDFGKALGARYIFTEDQEAEGEALRATMAFIRQGVMGADPGDCAALNSHSALAVKYVVRYVAEAKGSGVAREKAYQVAVLMANYRYPRAGVSNSADMDRILDEWLIPYMIFEDARA